MRGGLQTLTIFFCCSIFIVPVAAAQETSLEQLAARLQTALQELQEGQGEAAQQKLQGIVDSLPRGESLTTAEQQLLLSATIANAKALTRMLRFNDALGQYRLALDLYPATSDRSPLLLIAAELAVRCEQSQQAETLLGDLDDVALSASHRFHRQRIEVLSAIAGDDLRLAWQRLERMPDQSQPAVTELAKRLAGKALSQNQPKLADLAYRLLRKNSRDDAELRTAELGIAWAAASGASDPRAAAQLLGEFSQRYPEDKDLLRVLRAEAACWKQAGEHDLAGAALRKVVQQHRENPTEATEQAAIAATAELVLSFAKDDTPQLANFRHRLIADWNESKDLLPVALMVAGFSDAAADQDESLWRRMLQMTAIHPAAATIVQDSLQGLSERGYDAASERLAVYFLSSGPFARAQSDRENASESHDESRPPLAVWAACCEAVCLWAAQSGHWSMLALAASQWDAEQAMEILSVDSKRFLAEALLQTRRTGAAKRWFEAAVSAGADDFSTLLRAAELAVALDELGVAEQRVVAARERADQHDQGGALVEMLQAELAIRRARLEEARQMLERLVRMDRADRSLRCRAQWLIGETYLMQQKYDEAVSAYRLVESLEPTPGVWTSAALVQAGKAFEKLGRHRDAAICYSGLLQRFADSEHAAAARQRLAAMQDESLRR